MGDQIITSAPPPWQLRGTVYMISFWAKAGKLPEHAYSPLERDSSFASPESGQHLGGLSQMQIIRYTESPVGPYDEFAVCPGLFSYETEGEDGKRERKKNVRTTRIYVSQKHTCWNGRKHWNIPKHLARFEWADLPDGKTKVSVFPHDTVSDASESQPSDRPLFQTTFQPVRWVPSFPLSLDWARYVGIDTSVVHPPLPEGHGSQNELPGTERWCKVVPLESTRQATLGWADMSQRDDQGSGDGGTVSSVECENFWPDIGRWQLAIKMQDAVINFGIGEYWDAPRTKL
ncbi:hypothetical protein F5X99DRAFT_397709 [Biscogniauxia marginata]|nr:hypothetical protein F5X99DRAFT_397709 [Biscogniauxia marginata]